MSDDMPGADLSSDYVIDHGESDGSASIGALVPYNAGVKVSTTSTN